MISSAFTYGQQSVDFFGASQSPLNSRFRLNSLESNAHNLTLGKDWEISTSFSGVNGKDLKANLFSFSISKRSGAHYIFARYTPGYLKEFIFSGGATVILNDSQKVLQKRFRYDEAFGLGYSFRFSPRFTAGFSIRYFQQEFRDEQLEPFFSDSLNYIKTKTTVTPANFWRGDAGLNYFFSEKFSLSLSSINLFSIEESAASETASTYSIKKKKGALVEIKYQPIENIGLQFNYETNNSFVGGINISTNFLGGSFTAGVSAFHDKYQNPFIAGILPVINFSSNLFSVTLSGVKYFSNRSGAYPLSELVNKGINNLMNNSFSYDRAVLSVNFALSFVKEQLVKFVDVQIKEEIFPTLGDKYFSEPFAAAKVVNVSDKIVQVRPSSIIKNVNAEVIYSPTVKIAPGDTIEIPFYTVISNDALKITRREISQADFYLTTTNSEPDDEMHKPILVNDNNSWDGKVPHLKYFVRRDFDFANRYAKNIFEENKEKIENVGDDLEIFEKVKILFDHFVKKMVYVSDPRSSVERVQFPSETIDLKGGDCDDLSVSFSSLLESVGIQTAFVDYKNDDGISHVNLLVNTQLKPLQGNLITNNDKKIFIRKNAEGEDEIWIPLETTSLTNFDTAWTVATEKFNKEAIEELGLAKGKIQIIDIK